MSRKTVVILDYGSQYAMLIARRVRECQVYSELIPWDAPEEEALSLSPSAFILSGGPASVLRGGSSILAPICPEERATGSGHLLRDAAFSSSLRREGSPGPQERVRACYP